MSKANYSRMSQEDLPQEVKPECSKPHVPSSVWVLGWMMFLINMSFIMIYGLSGVYLKKVMGVSTVWIALMEGTAEAASYSVKLFSGVISDYLKRRRIIIIIGYGMMVISKPLLAFASVASPFGIACSRFLERVGNGIQGTPRDALVSDIAPPHSKGACYGLKRSLGQAGSVTGGIVGFLLMGWFLDFQIVFWFAAIPASCGLFLLITMVKEPETNKIAQKNQQAKRLHFRDLKRLSLGYWLLIMVVAVFMLARVNETMIALHAQNFDLGIKYTPLIMMLYNGTYCLIAYPIGKLSDRIGRFPLLSLTIGVLIAADLFLGFATNLWIFFIGVAIWGLQMGMAQSLFMGLIADMTPKDLRGTSFGFYYLTLSIASVFAGWWAGYIAQNHGEGKAFLMSSVIAGASLVLLNLVVSFIKKRSTPHQSK